MSEEHKSICTCTICWCETVKKLEERIKTYEIKLITTLELLKFEYAGSSRWTDEMIKELERLKQK